NMSMWGNRHTSIALWRLLLSLTVLTITEQKDQSVVVRAGTRVTLPCGLEDRDNCENTDWLFAKLQQTSPVELVRSGLLQTSASSKSRPERMRVTGNCSLVVKEVTAQDAGLYCCRQDEDGRTKYAVVYLSVVNSESTCLFRTIYGHRDDSDKMNVTFLHQCTVKWLLKGGDVDEDNGDLKTSQSGSSATVSFKSSHFIYKSENYEPLTCQVTEGFTEKRFLFRPRSSGEKPKRI
uniref:Ig-like domain-containing protein n=1 Tax=Scophthalmus maximus TaxID=52904 RepID=A0A8D3EC74_SCOMX